MLKTLINLSEYHKLVDDSLSQNLFQQGVIALQQNYLNWQNITGWMINITIKINAASIWNLPSFWKK
jgi:hypothetical protein